VKSARRPINAPKTLTLDLPNFKESDLFLNETERWREPLPLFTSLPHATMFLHPEPVQPPAERPTHELVVPRHDVQWCRPVFKAPVLTSPRQWKREAPFSAAFPVKRFSADRAKRRTA
jgi:hypothetical protein